MKLKFKLFFVGIILIAAFSRLLFLGDFPNGFTGDEAQQGYSAYSILKTGKDEWGETLPLFPRGFGDYKPPLYTYLAVPSVAVFGLSVEGVRVPAVIAGILTVIFVYFLTKEILKDEKIALWSALLLAINPWHIQLSRTAWEGGIGILTFSLGLLFYLKSGMNKFFPTEIRNLIIAAFFFGLTLYSYHSWRVFVILFILGLILLSWKKIFDKKNLVAGLILLVFSLPLIININLSLARSADVGIFSEQQISGYFENKEVTSLPPILDRILDNKIWFVVNQFFTNYLSYFSPVFYFTDARSDNTYLNFPYLPLLYPLEVIFFLSAIFIFISQKIPNKNLIILWLVLAPIPAALAAGSMNANRVPTLLPVVIIISAVGLSYFLSKWKLAQIPIIFIFAFSFLIFLNFYFFKLPQKPPDNLRYGYDKVFKKVLEEKDNYDEIVISKVFTEPQIFIAFYSNLDPNIFQQASKDWRRYEKSDKLYVDQLQSWNLGKFYFEDINWSLKDSNRINALIVSKPEDFPQDVESILDVYDSKKKMLYRLVPVNYEKN